jgi:hypothetical protein
VITSISSDKGVVVSAFFATDTVAALESTGVNSITGAETMWTKKESKPADLSDSVNLAHETLRQAIEIWYGREISIVGNSQLTPSSITKGLENGTEFRFVSINLHFCFLSEYRLMPAHALVHLNKIASSDAAPARWKLDRMHFATEDGDEPRSYRHWFWAHRIGNETVLPTIKVALEISKTEECDYQWRVGRTIADRRLVPLYSKEV